MKYFFDSQLAERYGYGMAVFIAAETFDLQLAIEKTNARREREGRRSLEDAQVVDVLSALRNRGLLPVPNKSKDGANLSDAGAAT